MHYASIENISKSFGVRTLFKNITLNIEEGDKIALVARNGSGKSTLLKIITGLDTPDTGTIWVHKDIKVVMLQQDNDFDNEKTIWDNVLRLDNPVVKLVKEYELFLEEGQEDVDKLGDLMARLDDLNAWSFESDLKQILGKLNLHHLNEKVGNLSGGQKKRVALAQALIEADLHQGRCLLILDEPTNHLDVSMIEWLEDYLAASKLTLLLVTHDRYFLDAVCNEIVEIDEEKVYVYKGDYDNFLEQKSLRLEVQQSELQKDKNIFRKELEWMRKQPKARTTKSKSRQDAFVEVEERVKQQKDVEEVSLQVKMTRLGGKILELKKVYKSYGDLKIMNGFDYTFKRGERIGVVGKNGVGKSTFLKIALQLEEPDSGKINHGDTVVFGNFSQDGLVYKEDKRAIEYVKDMAEYFPLADGTKISASMFMEKFGFSAEQQFTPLSKLSGGEKRRLHLMSVLFLNPNFLVLDEPTNDLDLQTLRTLEEFLMDYPGCILIVSHDRYFMDRMVDHLFAFEGDAVIRDYPGNYTQYRAAVANGSLTDERQLIKQAPKAAAEEVAVETVAKPTKTSAPKLSFKEKFEFETIEKEMPLLQKEKAELEQKMNEGNLSFDELQKAAERVGIIVQQLDEKEMRWLELSERI
ncbi:ABC-F family ATP-binding cassette domain-containing protein [Ferruginibacter lapsinanis]|uniref:ABC-F family ATP-binding cassette domain-containing protein n=1 Tax=Ferruginibacter lapsinanis TaxID=563172 RepID=UPI001E3417FE|nr:ABC-F family ATP-binding cassette domain-containing protein [Ferruginibacter lapsinanis]UEG50577.1 ABC-F family ATP-binding cassette domain-containing protein [Ferruginibacter lapsinanis]